MLTKTQFDGVLHPANAFEEHQHFQFDCMKQLKRIVDNSSVRKNKEEEDKVVSDILGFRDPPFRELQIIVF